MDPQNGRAEEAGAQMSSELDEIQERLRALKRKLEAREAVIDVGDEDEPVELASNRRQM